MTGEERGAADRGESSRRMSRKKRDQREQTTDRTGEASDQFNTISGRPDVTSERPDTTTVEPQQTTGRTGETSNQLNTISGRPDVTSERPDAATVDPQQTTDRIRETSDQLNTISGRPDVTSERPDTATVEPQQTTNRTGETSDQPDTISERPDTTTVQPDTTSDELDMIAGQHDTTTTQLEQTKARSDDTHDEPNTINKRRDTTAVRPATGSDQLETISGQPAGPENEPSEPAHTTVLLDEVLEFLQPRAGIGFRALDATVGAGGHSFGLLERSSADGSLLGLDADAAALELARARLAPFAGRYTLYQRNFADLGALGFAPVDAIVFDLGLSSMQLAASGRGFSFRADEPLDMRFDPSGSHPTAAELLNTASEAELERILREHGEEPRARRVVRSILQRRPIERTGDLVAAVTAALGPTRGRIHPATRTFQALRIAVNDELAALEAGLDAGLELLAPGGRIAVISFHSLEDRIVKWRFRGWADRGLVRVLTKRPVQPGDAEVQRNPRARSAKLRVAERLDR